MTNIVEKLPEYRQNEFSYRGKIYKAFANFGFLGWNVSFTHLFQDNIGKDTPSGYTYEEFKKTAYRNNASAELYECEERLLVPFSTFLAEYRNEAHPV